MTDTPEPGISRRSLLQARGRRHARRRSRRGGRRLREHHDARGRRAAPAAAAKGLLGDPTAGGPVDAAGIPLARRDYPVTLPRIGDIVSSSAKPERGGELRIYNYADYIDPAVIKAFGKAERRQRPRDDVRDARRGVLEAQHRRPRVRRDLLDAGSALAPGRPPADPAAQPRARPEPAEERLARGGQPVLRRRPALLGPLRRLHDRRRLAQRQGRHQPERAADRSGTRSGGPRTSAARSSC